MFPCRSLCITLCAGFFIAQQSKTGAIARAKRTRSMISACQISSARDQQRRRPSRIASQWQHPIRNKIKTARAAEIFISPYLIRYPASSASLPLYTFPSPSLKSLILHFPFYTCKSRGRAETSGRSCNRIFRRETTALDFFYFAR